MYGTWVKFFSTSPRLDSKERTECQQTFATSLQHMLTDLLLGYIKEDSFLFLKKILYLESANECRLRTITINGKCVGK